MSDGILLEAQGVAHAFDYPLFEEVSLTLRGGESKAITGRSGSGKSTLLHIFSTFLAPQKGTVRLFGRDIYTLKNAEVEALRRFDLGIVFQFHYLFKGMTGRENLEVATLLAKREIDPWLLERLEIAEVIDRKIGELSGGQQQRVSIARVLAKKPRILFADEPTGNLDKQTAALVIDVLKAYVAKENAGLVLVTHDEEIAKGCDAHYRLRDKRLSPVV